MSAPEPIRFGADELLRTPERFGRTARLGLVTNDAARLAADASLRTRVALQRAGLPLARLFSPEHGLAARAPDGAAVGDALDAHTGLPVVSLYGEQMRPPAAALAGLAAVLFDVPDVGARFYTYIWTLSHVLDVCAEAGVPLLVLDRPNPLGGELARCEGPLLDEARCASFLGRAALPVRHGLTAGEFARLWQRERQPGAALEVVPARGWRRTALWPELRLPWVPPSPAMTSFDAALLYPGLCLFEATNLSAGRGTRWPFQVIGAPWLDAGRLAERLRAHSLPGVSVQPLRFTPAQAPHAGLSCEGVRLRVENVAAVRPVALGLRLLAEVVALRQPQFAWARYPTAANPTGAGHFERLVGRPGLREKLEAGAERLDDARLQEWTAAPGWAARAEPCLLYAGVRG